MSIKVIDSFSDEYWFLSNFYESEFEFEGNTWKTVEHYYQAQKTLDMKEFNAIRDAETPNEAKKLGQICKLREDWESIKFFVMKKALNEKFALGSKLCERLLDTRDACLIEGNYWHDNVWGNCECAKCKDKKGQNMLGNELRIIRSIRKWQKEHMNTIMEEDAGWFVTNGVNFQVKDNKE